MDNLSKRKVALRTSLAGIAAIGGLFAYNSVSAQSENAATSFSATLSALPNTSGSGKASLRLSADRKTLLVHITARGLEAGGQHVSHIHGLSSGGQPVNSTCPTLAQDTDRDTFVELDEGLATYGPILIDFMNIDPNQDGVIDFRTTIRLTGSEGILPLADREIVVHGMSVGAVGAGTPGEVDGTAGYKTVLPVLCGAIVATGTKEDPLKFRTR